MSKEFLFTSESVSEGHPDKVCDQISDSILDALLEQDPFSRVACETLVKSNLVVLAGEVTSNAKIDFEEIARERIRKIGYTSAETGCDANNLQIITNINQQSSDIAQGVNLNEGKYEAQGAGDQGIMFGYACNETPELMPMAIALSHRLVKRLADYRHTKKVDYLRPDSKSQVTVRYENSKPVAVETVVISTQHTPNVDQDTIRSFVIDEIVPQVIPSEFLNADTKYYVNPTGLFISGGPEADAGLTGRKIVVDTYGGFSRHGGGAFSGKDPSKVDRSATYATRYVAKNIVAAGLAERCEIQVSYAIGVADPVSVLVNTFGTGKIADEKIADSISGIFSLRPRKIIEGLDLLKPIYVETAAYGHFGREPGSDGSFSWEKVDIASDFEKLLG